MMRVSEFYAAVMDWAMSFGVVSINQTPGLWHRRTEKIGTLGPLDVRINPHKTTIDNVPPFHVKIGMDDYFPGLIALIGPTDGMIIRGRPGEDEAGLITHFKEQVNRASEAATP